MPRRKSIGTDAKATSHAQNKVARETVAQDTVQQLIAFASTILVYPIESEGRLFNKEWVGSLSCWPNLLRTSQLIRLSDEGNHRLTRILDSIANICVSGSKGEVVAAAAQISKRDMRLIVASNDTLPDSTITHLKEIWNILKQLSTDYQDYNRLPENSASPRQPLTKDLSKNTQLCIQNLWQKILRFSHQRLRQRVSKHYLKIISINEDVAKEFELEPIIRQLKALKPALDLPALADRSWDYVWAVLEHIRHQFDKVAVTIKTHKNTPRIPFSLFRYLSKVVSVIQDIKVLMKAANSPRLRALFHQDLKIINVKGSGDIPFNLPRSREGWTQVVQDALQWRNMTAKTKGEVKFKLDSFNVEQHAARMCETPPRSTNFVHCELNIISYILQSSEEGFLDYIGISKLCCRGCSQYIHAVEYVLGKRFSQRYPSEVLLPMGLPNPPICFCHSRTDEKHHMFCLWTNLQGFLPRDNILSLWWWSHDLVGRWWKKWGEELLSYRGCSQRIAEFSRCVWDYGFWWSKEEKEERPKYQMTILRPWKTYIFPLFSDSQ